MTRSLLLALALMLAAPLASAQLATGAAPPMADQPLAAADGSTLSLAQAAGPSGLVVMFWSNACPWTDRYAPRLASLVERYAPAGIGFVLVNPNDPTANQHETVAASREAAAKAGLAVPYLADPTGAVAAAFGATNAPHVYFFDGSGALRYDGALDDSPASANRVRVPYLAQAMDQSIAGLPVEVQRTQAFGCSIKRAGE
ncbi:redoxin domain-containing protein [Rubrivirga sp. IMCC45206]|uniref:redoxin domain-containing protein n=1 Tax=Rubrivirga sp. IMCC45206 TaxID=3391614 RepID=UPI00398FE4DF